MDKIQFSILIPVYNVEKYIKECLESVIHQTFSDFEAIVVDDGSTDNSGMICEQYAQKDGRIKVIHQNNQGLMMSRKNAIMQAKGKYCLFLDSDDYYEVTLLERMYAEIQKNEPDMLMFNIFNNYKNNEIIEPLIEQNILFLSQQEMLIRFASSYKFNSVVLKMMKREILLSELEKIYVPINYAEDMRQTAFLILSSSKIEIMNEGFYHYRMRKSSLIHQMSVERIEETLQVKKDVASVLCNEGKIGNENLKTYHANTLSDFMDCIYRLNNKSGYVIVDSMHDIKKLEAMESVKELFATADNSRMPLYNKIRYWFFKNRLFLGLIIIDKGISVVEKQRAKKCGYQFFD